MHPFKPDRKGSEGYGTESGNIRGLPIRLANRPDLTGLPRPRRKMENFKDEELHYLHGRPHAVYTCSKEYLIKYAILPL